MSRLEMTTILSHLLARHHRAAPAVHRAYAAPLVRRSLFTPAGAIARIALGDTLCQVKLTSIN